MPRGYEKVEPGVQRSPDGRYWIRASMRHPRTGKLISRSATLAAGTLLHDARKQLAALRVELEEGATAPTSRRRGRTTVSKCAVRWIAGHYERNRESTVDHYRQVLTDHILPAPVGPGGTCFGELFAEAVTRTDIDRWCRWAECAQMESGEGYAADTVKGWWRVLCGFLRDTAADLGRPDPIVRVRPPKIVGRPKRRERRTLTTAQLAALVEVVVPHRRAEVYLLAYTGMRAGELYALEWGDIDVGKGCIHVRRSHRMGQVYLTKTDDPRDVALTEPMSTVLDEHRRLSMAVDGDAVALPPAVEIHFERHERLVNADVRRLLGWAAMKARRALARWYEAGLLVRKGAATRPYYVRGEGRVAVDALPAVPTRPLVFPSRTGGYRGPDSLYGPLAAAAAAAGITQRVTPQVLRRTFNTLMVLAGVDRTVVRSQMGHCSEEMTERYAGVSIEVKRAAVMMLEQGGARGS